MRRKGGGVQLRARLARSAETASATARRARFSACDGLVPNSLKIWVKAFSQLASISGQRALKGVLPSSWRSSSSSRDGWSARLAPDGTNSNHTWASMAAHREWKTWTMRAASTTFV